MEPRRRRCEAHSMLRVLRDWTYKSVHCSNALAVTCSCRSTAGGRPHGAGTTFGWVLESTTATAERAHEWKSKSTGRRNQPRPRSGIEKTENGIESSTGNRSKTSAAEEAGGWRKEMRRLNLHCEKCNVTEKDVMLDGELTRCPKGHERVVEWSGGGPEWSMRSHSYTGRRTTAGRKR